MRLIAIGLFVCGLALTVSFADAQPPGQDKKGPKGGKGGEKGMKGGRAMSTDDLVAQMMTFDKNGDGKLTKDEITDPRLVRLFERADKDKDGVVTKEELAALFTAEASGGSGFGDGGPGGPKGGEFGGPKGFGPPRPGTILPPFIAEQLGLTDDQKKQLEDIQKAVDAGLDKILTDDQKKQLEDIRPKKGPGGGQPPARFEPTAGEVIPAPRAK